MTTIRMSSKLRSVVTYNEDLQLIKLHDPSIIRFYEVTSQI